MIISEIITVNLLIDSRDMSCCKEVADDPGRTSRQKRHAGPTGIYTPCSAQRINASLLGPVETSHT